MNIYLDIDGVILANEKQPALHVKEFLAYCVEHNPTFWLTTHCKGDADYTVNHINRFFDIETLSLLKKIKPTNWITAKTEAIDFNVPFLWFDDQVFDFEIKELEKHNALNNWIKVDLEENPNQLKDLLDFFKNLKK